jgi:hypothetical protein
MIRILLLTLAAATLLAQVAGNWRAEFDTQVGTMKYRYTFAVDGAKLTGKAAAETPEGQRESAITEGLVKGDKVQFVETLQFQGQDIRIEYTGILKGDEIKFTRQVGSYATEDFIAKRVTGQ